MKKLFLFCAAVSLSLGVSAQEAVHQSVLFGHADHAEVVRAKPAPMATPLPSRVVKELYPSKTVNTSGLERKTGVGDTAKWYSYFNTVDQLLGGTFTSSTSPNITWGPMWWDSTVTQRYSNGMFSIANAGVCNQFAPAYYTQYNNTLMTSIVSPTDIKVTPGNDYKVDSVAVYAAYIRNTSRPAGVRDTLIISVAPQHYKIYYNQSWISNNPSFAASGDSVMHVAAPYYTDSMNRAAFSDSAGLARAVDTFILNPLTDGHVPDLSSGTGERDTLQTYLFPINGGKGVNIPRGMNFTVTVSFKSGDVSSLGDSVTMFNRFCPVWGFEGTGSAISWMTYWYGQDTAYHDYNGSSKIDPRAGITMPDFYFASIAQQAYDADPKYVIDQYLDVQAHVVCTSCYTVGVQSVNKVITKVNAYPNPASTQINIPFTLAHTANVNVQVSNVLGQVVKTQNFSNVKSDKAVFNTSNLANGVYFYTISADGQNFAGRFVVTH